MLAILRQRLAPRALKPLARQASSYSEKMDKTGRPISPHVFIYRFPTIAISSIMVRISGVMLTVGALPSLLCHLLPQVLILSARDILLWPSHLKSMDG